MRRFGIFAVSCLLCAAWVTPGAGAEYRNKRPGRAAVRIRRNLMKSAAGVPMPLREANEKAVATLEELMREIRIRFGRAGADFAWSRASLSTRQQEREAAFSRSKVEVEDLSKQTYMDYEKGMSLAKLRKEIHSSEAQELEADLVKKMTQSASQIARLKRDLDAYVAATQAGIDKLGKEIETVEQEETARFTDVRKQAESISKRIAAEIQKLTEETKAYEQNELARAEKLNADANALEKDFRAEVSKLRSETSLTEKQGEKNFETEKVRIDGLAEKYAAEVAKLRVDVEVSQKILDAGIESESAEIVRHGQDKLAKITSLKEVLENDLANKRKKILEWQAEANALEEATDAEDSYQKVKAESEKIRIDEGKEIEAISAISGVKERREAKGAADAGRRDVGLYYNKLFRDISVPWVEDDTGSWEGETLTRSAGRLGTGLKLGMEVRREIGSADTRRNRIKIQALRKLVASETKRLMADRNELTAMIDAMEKKLEAEIVRGNLVTKAGKTARQSDTDLIEAKADQLEKAHRAGIKRLRTENKTDLEKTAARVVLLGAKADRLEKEGRAEVTMLRATADAVETNVAFEVKNRMSAIAARAAQGEAMTAKVLAKADALEADMEETLATKSAQMVSDEKVMEALVIAKSSEIQSKTEMAVAKGKSLMAEIAAHYLVAESVEEKMLAELKDAKTHGEAMITEKRKLLGIHDTLYTAEIQQLLVQAGTSVESFRNFLNLFSRSEKIRRARVLRSSR